MKKFATIAVVVLMAGLFASPAMAQAIGSEGEVGVAITVAQYCAIQIAPAPLVMTVNDIQAPGGSPVIGGGYHEANTSICK